MEEELFDQDKDLNKEMIQQFLYEEIVVEGKSRLEAFEKLMRVLGISIPETE